jgi:hypothetical protein
VEPHEIRELQIAKDAYQREREECERLREALRKIEVQCCMQARLTEEFWCRHDGSVHSSYCAAGIARAALAAVEGEK